MQYLGFIINYYRVERYCPSIKQQTDKLTALWEELGIVFKETIEETPPDGLLPYLHKKTADCSEEDAVVLAFIDSEFYSLEDNKKLLENVERYGCDIGFGDNFPEGVIFEVVRRHALPVLENVRISKKIAHSRKLLTDLIHVDVNMFDLENLYAQTNLRTFRLSFFQDNQQNSHTIAAIKKFFPFETYNQTKTFDDLANSIITNRNKLRTIPKYYEIAISNQCEQKCIFCPKTHLAEVQAAFMSLEDYQTILTKIVDFTDKPIICLTGLGEATLNKACVDILQHTLQAKVECYLETSAVSLNQKLADEILALPNQDLLKVIFSLDAFSEKMYQTIRPFNEKMKNAEQVNFTHQNVIANIEYFLIRKKKNSYIQIVKTEDNFEELAKFHNHFTNNYAANVIVQKYNTYRGFLQERRLNPMQPLERIDCWHLKRDMVIDVKGQVHVCKQDIKGEHLLGNILTDNIEVIFNTGQAYFEKHVANWSFCTNCDEHYTYNA